MYLDLHDIDLQGNVGLPASKSISNRALILNALSGGVCDLRNVATCDDTDAMQCALRFESDTIDIGAAGTAMRFLTAFLAQKDGEFYLTGTERMCQRPIGALVDALCELGADITYTENDGFPPLKINGKKLHGGELTPHFGQSSQFFSAIMMIAPLLDGGLTLHYSGELTSKPYIYLTQYMMCQFGVEVAIEADKIIIPQANYIAPQSYTIENDWSAASYWYELLALRKCGSLQLPHLYAESLQGDSKIAELFELFGVRTVFVDGGIEISYFETQLPRLFQRDFADMPDMVQTFAVMCCALGVKFIFSGVHTLKIKETDRIAALIAELKKCGFVIDELGDELVWSGSRCTPQTDISIATYNDHRMAMAFAPMACVVPLSIENPEVVSKSYPNFWNELARF